MSFLLDTNIVSFHMRKPRGLAHRFMQHSGHLFVSSIALAELFVWAFKKANPSAAIAGIDFMLKHEVQRLDFDERCAKEFGRLRVVLNRKGIPVATPDLLIASVALVHNFTLVTNNTADFQNLPGLRLDDWLTP